MLLNQEPHTPAFHARTACCPEECHAALLAENPTHGFPHEALMRSQRDLTIMRLYTSWCMIRERALMHGAGALMRQKTGQPFPPNHYLTSSTVWPPSSVWRTDTKNVYCQWTDMSPTRTLTQRHPIRLGIKTNWFSLPNDPPVPSHP